ncbi:hypothetical protein AB0N19_28850, partial [Streptomyces sp. NPDC051132]
PGYALLFDQDKGKNQRRNPIRLRYMTAQQVIALPDRPVWRRESAPAVAAGAPAAPTLRLVKDDDFVLAPPAQAVPAAAVAAAVPAQPAPATNREKVKAAVGAGAKTPKDVALITGLNKGTVSREVKALVEAGEISKAADGSLSVTATEAGEVSA